MSVLEIETVVADTQAVEQHHVAGAYATNAIPLRSTWTFWYAISSKPAVRLLALATLTTPLCVLWAVEAVVRGDDYE